ncbi:MAG: lipase [Spirochaetaceae bacterium]|nr:lipase [Spirochaetaceae bacterium]|tara:strand:- start:16065 stop:16994 length:930 start_codon:yes stop_codon:yes gene_type:complete
MRNKVLSGALILALLPTASVFAGGEGPKPLDGSYPIVLNHGLFGWGNDGDAGAIGILDAWGGLDEYLREEGAPVFAPSVTAVQSSAVRAQVLKEKLNYWMAARGFTKVNLIGHSQGGLDGRYMVSNLGMSDKVAVLTTVATPHRGSPSSNALKDDVPDWAEPYIADLINMLVPLIWGGSTQQDVLAVLEQLSTDGMAAFNQYTPDSSNTRYYSYGTRMKYVDYIQHPLMAGSLESICAGGEEYGLGCANDGTIPLQTTKWGTFMGEPNYPWYSSGVDHLQSANGAGLGYLSYDPEGFYLQIATNAMNNQ